MKTIKNTMELNVYEICKKIMENQSIQVFYPVAKTHDKNGKAIKKNIAMNTVHNDELKVIRKVFTDNTSIDIEKCSNNVRIMEIIEFLKREYRKNPNNYSVSVERLSTLRISLSDNKFVFGKNENYSIDEVSKAVALFVLNKNCKNGKMLQIHTIFNNGVKSRVINTVPFIPNFYTKKEVKNVQKKEKQPIEKILEVANSSIVSKVELLAIISKLQELYNDNNSIDKLIMKIEEFGKGSKVE